MLLWVLVVEIYEAAVGDAYPVVVHEFIGRTQQEARGYFDAHMQTDAFLRGCVDRARWRDVSCTTKVRWQRRERRR